MDIWAEVGKYPRYVRGQSRGNITDIWIAVGERIKYNFLPPSVKPKGPDKESRVLLSAEILSLSWTETLVHLTPPYTFV